MTSVTGDSITDLISISTCVALSDNEIGTIIVFYWCIIQWAVIGEN